MLIDIINYFLLSLLLYYVYLFVFNALCCNDTCVKYDG